MTKENSAKFAANTPSARKSLANLDAIQPANKVLNGEQLTRSVIKALNAQNFKLEYSHGNYAAVEKQINQDFDAKIWNETAQVQPALNQVCTEIAPLLSSSGMLGSDCRAQRLTAVSDVRERTAPRPSPCRACRCASRRRCSGWRFVAPQLIGFGVFVGRSAAGDPVLQRLPLEHHPGHADVCRQRQLRATAEQRGRRGHRAHDAAVRPGLRALDGRRRAGVGASRSTVATRVVHRLAGARTSSRWWSAWPRGPWSGG